jgi:hypothetical protein
VCVCVCVCVLVCGSCGKQVRHLMGRARARALLAEPPAAASPLQLPTHSAEPPPPPTRLMRLSITHTHRRPSHRFCPQVTSLYHKQSAQPWSKDEVSTLRRMADADVPWHEIGQEMGRSGQVRQASKDGGGVNQGVRLR